MLDTPVLFIIFNRPNYTKKVFAQIRKIKPKLLFIAADGPRAGNSKDFELCIETRKIIEKIDWDCEVKTLFRDENLGCAKGVSGAITWFFEHVEEGIILEDDCVPDLSFFLFCEIMLAKYRNSEEIMHITGTNHLFDRYSELQNSYFFSAYISVWGWATWKRAWAKFSLEMKDFDAVKTLMNRNIKNAEIIELHSMIFKKAIGKEIDSWATYWNYHCQINEGKSATPCVNLIKNIGENGIHYKGFRTPFLSMPVKPFSTRNIVDPIPFELDFEKDNVQYLNILYPKFKIKDRIYNKLKRLYYRIHKS
jgi:hypothetical protein